MSPNARASLVLLAALFMTVWWVYLDATKHAADGEPVVFRGSVRLETPAAWALVCLVLWLFFFPLYLWARERTR